MECFYYTTNHNAIFVGYSLKIKRNAELTEKVKSYFSKIGADLVGFADPELFNRYSEKNRPNFYQEDSQTVIILGIHLYDIILDAWNRDQSSGRNFHFADSILENLCYRTKQFLNEFGFRSEVIPYNPGLYLKEAAVLAGIGIIGKNNLFITEKFGSQVRLRALATTAPLVTGTPISDNPYCKSCNICIKSCPAKAFPNDEYNKEICETYQLSHLKHLSEDTTIWCNVCIEVCPIGKKK